METTEEGYKLECGCECIFVEGFGWHTIQCEKHEDELEALQDEPVKFHKVRRFTERESI